MDWKQPRIYAAIHRNEKVREESRSGGIFTALSDYVLSENGVIYGCVLTKSLQAVHARADDFEGRNRMRGSKYIQSKMNDTFKMVKEDLNAGRKVLFSGTSCQVAGLRAFLGKVYENLICVDIVCHGVPSPKVWKEYLQWQESKNKAKIVRADFRNKKEFGWSAHKETLMTNDGKSISGTVFTTIFYGHCALRPSCYECPYKSIMHPGDITIADYWGIEKAAPEFDDNKGVSLVLINNESGSKAFECVKGDLKWKSTRLENSMQPPLKAPFPKPAGRDQFWKDFSNQNFDYIAKKYGGGGAVNEWKRRLRKMKRRLVGR